MKDLNDHLMTILTSDEEDTSNIGCSRSMGYNPPQIPF